MKDLASFQSKIRSINDRKGNIPARIILFRLGSYFKKSENILLSFLVVVLSVTPLIPVSFGMGYEQIKVIFFLILMTTAAFIWIGLSFKYPDSFKTQNTPLSVSFISLLIIVVVTSFFGYDFRLSLIGNPPYFQGIVVYLYGFLLFTIVPTLHLRRESIYWSLTISSVLVALIAIYQWIGLHFFGQDIPTYAGRVVATFGQPNLFSGFILLTMPFTIDLCKKTFSLKKRILSVLVIIDIFGIVVSESRAAILLGLIILLWWSWVNFRDKIMKGIVAATIIGTICLSIYSLYYGTGIFHQELKPLNAKIVGDEGQERRVYIWAFIVDLIIKKPLTGYGLDNLIFVFNQALQDKNPKPAFYYTVKDLHVDRSHNELLDLLIFGGIPLCISWLMFYVLLWKHGGDVERFFLTIYFVWVQFQIPGIVHLILFFLIAGLVQQNYSSRKEKLIKGIDNRSTFN